MKTMLALLLALLAITSFAQIPGKKTDGPVTIFDSIQVNKGDTLILGSGSDTRNGNFVYIYKPANGWTSTPEINLSKRFTGARLVLKDFSISKSKRTGDITYGVVNSNGGLNEAVNIEAAITAGEIVAINGHRFDSKPAQQPVVIQQKASVADELAKLKKLLDDGVITKEEFDAQKKKLLDGN